jgi:hypothetical protein
MPARLFQLATCTLLAVLSTLPANAAIVQVKYEGAVNVVGANTTGFALGDRIWGEYFYDSTSPPVAGSLLNAEHAAVRYLSVNASNGYAGAVNFGVIQKPAAVTSHNGPLFPPDFYRVTNTPALVLSGIEWSEWIAYVDIVDGVAVVPPGEPLDYSNADGGIIISNGIADDVDHNRHIGPDGIDTETLGDVPDLVSPSLDFDDVIFFGPDLDSLGDAAIQSTSLGFPAPSGAFAQGAPASINLLMYGNTSPSPTSTVDPLAPSALDAVDTAKGTIYFGSFGTDDPRLKVEFVLTTISVVPEPASLSLAILATVAALIAQARKCSDPCSLALADQENAAGILSPAAN